MNTLDYVYIYIIGFKKTAQMKITDFKTKLMSDGRQQHWRILTDGLSTSHEAWKFSVSIMM